MHQQTATHSGLPPTEAAVHLKRHVVTLERWRRLRIGPPFYKVMSRVYYDRAELDAWLAAQRQATHRSHEVGA